ncbi:hypothetical protein DPMN_034075 [Dreissena polymorpha]|uniref:Uncharacterized protein n=1 Tax=Dreissena polymorpha TaxID=45954 RepID=A0A9D4RJR1_DREPO|nr:hypothetical protein DPMN_034075 [Dreissena polymorpha]
MCKDADKMTTKADGEMVFRENGLAKTICLGQGASLIINADNEMLANAMFDSPTSTNYITLPRELALTTKSLNTCAVDGAPVWLDNARRMAFLENHLAKTMRPDQFENSIMSLDDMEEMRQMILLADTRPLNTWSVRACLDNERSFFHGNMANLCSFTTRPMCNALLSSSNGLSFNGYCLNRT